MSTQHDPTPPSKNDGASLLLWALPGVILAIICAAIMLMTK